MVQRSSNIRRLEVTQTIFLGERARQQHLLKKSGSMRARGGNVILRRFTEEKARKLLGQARWLLILCSVAVIAFAAYAYTNKFDGTGMALFGLYWFAGVFYLIWLGRLA
jgi:hypothetical protein